MQNVKPGNWRCISELLVLEPQSGAHLGRRVRGPGLQNRRVGRVPSRGVLLDIRPCKSTNNSEIHGKLGCSNLNVDPVSPNRQVEFRGGNPVNPIGADYYTDRTDKRTSWVGGSLVEVNLAGKPGVLAASSSSA